MANNRLYCVCDGCGHAQLVLKSLGGWFAPSYAHELAEFMTQHGQCSSWGDCTEPTAFTFKFEDHPDPAKRMFAKEEQGDAT